MPQIMVSKDGRSDWHPITDVVIHKDGVLAAFVYEGKHLVLKRGDMSNRNWAEMFFKSASTGSAGLLLLGPWGALFGTAAGVMKFLSDKVIEGYYDVQNPKSKEPVIRNRYNTFDEDEYIPFS